MMKRRPVKRSVPRRMNDVTTRMVSKEEKRQLILTHAAARRPMDAVQRAGLWAGVIICLLFVVGVWVSSIGNDVQNILAKPFDTDLQKVLDAGQGKILHTEDIPSDLSDALLQVTPKALLSTSSTASDTNTTSTIISTSTR